MKEQRFLEMSQKKEQRAVWRGEQRFFLRRELIERRKTASSFTCYVTHVLSRVNKRKCTRAQQKSEKLASNLQLTQKTTSQYTLLEIAIVR